ncbi:MAG: tRNA (N6-isopentenyl adenosine(37)-C2)-methylthiotransferase MiaB [Puniceicoccales bacterium]|jgi:tRNA-2-methylthio-N6-dimethylallyladenosine synthase|nr:tRNA (N6-isopentenyl adenosine(37)-C2)-methylthiotransferase MiaB [Puniceicoccales bacterium]
MKQVFIKTYGCQMNERDTEAIRGLLKSHGYGITDEVHNADVILLNTCSIREQAEMKAIGKLTSLFQQKKRRDLLLGVFGCMAQHHGIELQKRIPAIDFIIGTEKLHHIADYLDRHFANTAVNPKGTIVDVTAEQDSQNKISTRDLKPGQVSAFVSIMQGCNMHCSYCIVPTTRGQERYRPMKDILDEIQYLIIHGVKEVTLLGQIVNHYGQGTFPMVDGKSPFVQLLEAIQGLDGIERIRFMSPHPVGFRHDLIGCFGRLSKLCPHIHLPLQSASDHILKAMKRPYSCDIFRQIVQRLRERVPDMAFSTDIIVGFPGETEEDFDKTVAFFDEIAFDMAFIFKYSPRSHTLAAFMEEQIAESKKEERQQVLLKTLERHSYEHNRKLIGTTQQVLVEGKAHRGESKFFGRNAHFRKVIFDGHPELIGQTVGIIIERASTTALLGKVLP